MSEKVTVEEQRAMGLRPARPNIVQPPAPAPVVRSMSEAESAALQGLAQPAMQQVAQPIQIPQGAHSGHVRNTEDPIVIAEASLRYSLAIAGASAITIGGLLLLATLQGYLEIGFPDAIGIEIVGTGIVTLAAMIINRSVGLHHSATGIAHHEIKATMKNHARSADVQEYEIDSRERIALHAIDRHAELIEKRWRLESGKNE